MIYDRVHRMFVVHEAGKKWILVQDEFLDPGALQHRSQYRISFPCIRRKDCMVNVPIGLSPQMAADQCL